MPYLTDCLSPCTEELWELSAANSSWEDRCCSQFSEIASKCHLTRLLYLHQNILWGFWDESYQSCTKVKVDIFGRHGVEWLTQDRKRGRRGVTQPLIQIVQQPTTRTRKLNVTLCYLFFSSFFSLKKSVHKTLKLFVHLRLSNFRPIWAVFVTISVGYQVARVTNTK